MPENSTPEKVNLKLPIMMLSSTIIESDGESLSQINLNLKNSPNKLITSPNKNNAYVKKSKI